MGVTIEIFTDTGLYGNEITERVRRSACPKCTVIVHDASDPASSADMQAKALAYGIAALPAVVMDGKAIPAEKLALFKK